MRPHLDSLDLVAVIGGRIRSAVETTADLGQITLRFLDGSNGSDQPDCCCAEQYIGPLGTWWATACKCQSARASITFRFDSTRASGTTVDSFLDGASLRIDAERIAPDLWRLW